TGVMKDYDERNQDAATLAGEVRTFYEHFPYPPPVDDLEKYRAWQDVKKRRAEYHLLWPSRTFDEDLSILIAGCGTSQAAKHAMRWPTARVTGIDFSETSVRCTDDLKRKYKLDNLQVRHLPIERVRELETSFDQIVCTGVLHHLPDPDAGLGALRGVLKPDGAMNVMLYAPYGRAGIYMLQDFCKRIGVGATDVEIRDLIAALKALPPGHPLQTLLQDAPDFRSAAALGDALLHPCDRAYSVPQFFEFLERGGLKFGRWSRQAAYSPYCGALAHIPQTERIRLLPEPEQFAISELFRGTMLRHSVIAYRDDAPEAPIPIRFADDAWLSYVPIPMPDTIRVQERLPAGAAAVLINQSHTYRDIYLAIDATEARLFGAIDGDREVAAIVKHASSALNGTPRPEAVRTLFERLWWHDQIVFDTSRKRRGVASAKPA
ncbi:MAG: class I SAM-dependent methyltransferase, partial [Casimicrobiaceae bacterium]